MAGLSCQSWSQAAKLSVLLQFRADNKQLDELEGRLTLRPRKKFSHSFSIQITHMDSLNVCLEAILYGTAHSID